MMSILRILEMFMVYEKIHLVAEPEKLFFSLEDASAPEKPGGGDDDQEEYNEEEQEGGRLLEHFSRSV